VDGIEHFEIGKFLKEPSASASGLETSVVWIKDGADNDNAIFRTH
jgi:hypothetical protein